MASSIKDKLKNRLIRDRSESLMRLPDEARSILKDAIYLGERGRMMDFDKRIKTLIKKWGKHPLVLSEIAKIYQYFDMMKEAEEFIRKAIELDPKSEQLYNNFAIIMMMKGKFKEAEDAFKKAIEINGENPYIWNDYGVLKMILGEIDEAIKSFKKAIELSGDFVEAYVNLGNLYYDNNMLEDARDMLEKAVKLDPNNAEAWFSLGAVYKLLGDKKKAKECKDRYYEIIEGS